MPTDQAGTDESAPDRRAADLVGRATGRLPDPTPDVDGPFGPRDTPRDLVVGFWVIVVLCNVAVFGLTVGPLVAFFAEDFLLGGTLAGVGGIAGVRALVRYRRLRDRRELWDDD